MNKQELKTFIDEHIVQNNSGSITANIINETYKNIIDCTEIGGENTTVSGNILVSKEGIDISASGDNPHIGIPTASGHINLGNNNVIINGTGHIRLSSGIDVLNIDSKKIGYSEDRFINFLNGEIRIQNVYCTGSISGNNIRCLHTFKVGDIYINSGSNVKINNDKCSLDFKNRIITGFNTIQMYSGSNSEITNVGRISGAAGKYIDLYNGSIVGISVNATVPSNLTPNNIYMSGSTATITNCNKLNMNPSASNGKAGIITGVSGIYFADGTGVISGTIGSMTINGIDLNANAINDCSGIYFAGPTREISGVSKISIGYGTITGLSTLNMISGNITGVSNLDVTEIQAARLYGDLIGNGQDTKIELDTNKLHGNWAITGTLTVNGTASIAGKSFTTGMLDKLMKLANAITGDDIGGYHLPNGAFGYTQTTGI